MYPCFGGPCSAYSRACARAGPLRSVYRRVVEPVMGYPRRAELWAAWTASAVHPDPWGACVLLGQAESMLRGARACVLGPLASRAPRGCDVVLMVEGLENVRPGLALEADIIVGDGDSSEPGVLARLCEDRLCFLHVHGDNYVTVSGLLRRMRAVPTSQAYCFWPVLGVGGFTDGDRAVLLAAVLGAREVVAVGFDFSRPFTGHKHAPRLVGPERKRAKLGLARRVVVEGARVLGMQALIRGSVVVLGLEN